MDKIFIAIPTVRNLNLLTAWSSEFIKTHPLIVKDHPDRQIETSEGFAVKTRHFAWSDIKSDFGKNEWIFSPSQKNAKAVVLTKPPKPDAIAIKNPEAT